MGTSGRGTFVIFIHIGVAFSFFSWLVKTNHSPVSKKNQSHLDAERDLLC